MRVEMTPLSHERMQGCLQAEQIVYLFSHKLSRLVLVTGCP
jgi:hypothetical protein